MENGNLLQTEIIKRLDILIKLMLETRPDNAKEKSTRSHVEFLLKLKLRPSEIANILGIETSNVTAYMATLKKQRGK